MSIRSEIKEKLETGHELEYLGRHAFPLLWEGEKYYVCVDEIGARYGTKDVDVCINMLLFDTDNNDEVLEKIQNEFANTTCSRAIALALQEAVDSTVKRKIIYINVALKMLEKCVFTCDYYQAMVETLEFLEAAYRKECGWD